MTAWTGGRLTSRSVRVNWFTSFLAAISYDADSTEPAFRVDINGDSEEHATVRFTLRAAWLQVGKLFGNDGQGTP
ncbi:hypothetical protein [Nonomuraea sp. NPDC049028]|uniref:hypothetical protein n=1 Tax=Nonomuraea sp. NPDC049028 TaxID=3364348 RepID=UPI003711DA16